MYVIIIIIIIIINNNNDNDTEFYNTSPYKIFNIENTICIIASSSNNERIVLL